MGASVPSTSIPAVYRRQRRARRKQQRIKTTTAATSSATPLFTVPEVSQVAAVAAVATAFLRTPNQSSAVENHDHRNASTSQANSTVQPSLFRNIDLAIHAEVSPSMVVVLVAAGWWPLIGLPSAEFLLDCLAWIFVACWVFAWIAFTIAICLAYRWMGRGSSPTSFVAAALLPTKQPMSPPPSAVQVNSTQFFPDKSTPPSTSPLTSPAMPPMGVSILKPLTGADDNLMHNLETFFRIQYSKFELLFCVHSPDDPAVPVVRTLIDRYPTVDAKLISSSIGRILYQSPASCPVTSIPPTAGNGVVVPNSSSPVKLDTAVDMNVVNPKIRNLLPAYDRAKYELIFISDCNIEAEPDTLDDVVSKMAEDPANGTVCQMHYVRDPPTNRSGFGLGALMNKVFFATQNAKGMLFLTAIGVPTTVSAALLIRRAALEEVGGLKPFGSYLQEDFVIGQALASRGWRHQLGRRLAWQNPAQTSVCDIFDRLVRWKRLRQATAPVLVVADPLTECFLLGLLASWAISRITAGTLPFLAILFGHSLLWFFLDFLLLTTINGPSLRFSKTSFLVAWLVREVSAPFIHLIALLRCRHVTWRQQRFLIRLGGRTERLFPSSAATSSSQVQTAFGSPPPSSSSSSPQVVVSPQPQFTQVSSPQSCNNVSASLIYSAASSPSSSTTVRSIDFEKNNKSAVVLIGASGTTVVLPNTSITDTPGCRLHHHRPCEQPLVSLC